ncbi:ATP-binding protein [Spirulina sp. CS-785/01]|uniref:sensor histidine kinase n=1 Tax=Spirulina sp. CS-785/01 TaxID=3021716 RepID=UPI00232AE7D6|nr:ATP-binding protein [Spirulina sp. CS-785/01]MDB9313791.1 ATP-binding protein [Spirulina sp. CS-785/01]
MSKGLQDKVQISIRDNGNGIPSENIDKIFTPFFTTKPTGEGTGLGLSLAHETIVSLHQGEVTVNSTPQEYTEITVFLPKEIYFQESSQNRNFAL